MAIHQTFLAIISNKIIISIFFSMAIAQITKFFVNWAYYNKIDWERFFETGGMPSSHTSTVIALTLGIWFQEGLGTILIITFVFSMIVIRDALGMRHEIGKQAKIINMIIKDLRYHKRLVHKDFVAKELKELIGHTPLQVMVGGLIGIAVTIVVFAR